MTYADYAKIDVRGGQNRVAMAGRAFGAWTVLRPGLASRSWFCRCVCGVERDVSGQNLRQGRSRSCGCAVPLSGTHHLTGSVEYRTWASMIARCEYSRDKSYARYGGRGISVCPRWRASFESFLSDMGKRPSDRHSIERVSVNGNYDPANCKWATAREQARNTRRTAHWLFRGVTASAAEWAERSGIKYQTLMTRVHALGWTVERALSTPRRGS